MKPRTLALLAAGVWLGLSPAPAADAPPQAQTQSSGTYVLSPNDKVQMKVFQEEDMQTEVRIGKDGTATFPLIGSVRIGGRTLEQASAMIRELLDRDFLVNPQVTLAVVEYAKRRFTVLGQVARPGTYEIPNEESASLLQAIAMAGGFTRLANPGKVTVTRVTGDRKVNYMLDARSEARDPNTKTFEVQAEDTISVPERFF